MQQASASREAHVTNFDEPLSSDLQTLLTDCNRDLEFMQNRLNGFSSSPGILIAGKIKRAIKIVVRDHELQDMWKKIHLYNGLFAVYLERVVMLVAHSIRRKNVDDFLPNCSSDDFHVLHDDALRTLKNTVAEQRRSLLGRIDSMESNQKAHSACSSTQLKLLLSETNRSANSLQTFRDQQLHHNNLVCSSLLQIEEQQKYLSEQLKIVRCSAHQDHLQAIQHQLKSASINLKTHQNSLYEVKSAVRDLPTALENPQESRSRVLKSSTARSSGSVSKQIRRNTSTNSRFKSALRRMLDIAAHQGNHDGSVTSPLQDLTTLLSQIEASNSYMLSNFRGNCRTAALHDISYARSCLEMSRRLEDRSFRGIVEFQN